MKGRHFRLWVDSEVNFCDSFVLEEMAVLLHMPCSFRTRSLDATKARQMSSEVIGVRDCDLKKMNIIFLFLQFTDCVPQSVVQS